MKKNIITTWSTLLLLLLYFGSTAQESPPLEQKNKFWFSQTKIGISTSGFQSTLSGVRTDLPLSYGFSGYPHTIEKTYGFSVAGLMQTQIYQFFEVEYGLGYFLEREKIFIDYIDWFTGEPEIVNLNINLHYIEFPLGVKLILLQKMNNQILLSSSLNTRLLAIQDDNYQYIVHEELGIPKRPFNKVMMNAGFSLGFRQKINDNYLEILAFQSYDLMSMLKEEGWGFYQDLYPARNSQVGIKINYFFKTLK